MLAELGNDAKADLNAVYTYIGMQIANLQQQQQGTRAD